MSIYDRDYMHKRPLRLSEYAITWIVGITIVVYLLQSVVFLATGKAYLEYFFAFRVDSLLSGRIWTPVTYAFLHSFQNPSHLIMNMIGLVLIGRFLNKEIGNQKFVSVYIFSAIFGAIAGLIINPGDIVLIGASAAVFGIMTLACLMHWEEEFVILIMFVYPAKLKPKFILIGLIIIELIMLMPEIMGKSMVASSSHLGGILGGFIFFRYLLHKDSWFEPVRKKKKVSSKGITRKSSPKFTINMNNRSALRKEVDRILDKINSQGFGTLTKEEKQTLDRAKDILNN